MKDVFEDGLRRRRGLPADVPDSSGTRRASTPPSATAALAEKHPGKFIVNTRWDPRDGDDGLQGARGERRARCGSKGVKLYTAEWRGGSRGWKLKDPEAYRYLEKCQELGIKNIHVHKGPTIWPLDKDAFDVSDVDHAATDFPELNFIVEHVGLPRIEDFCFMATQEPNVYAGLSVVIGGLMHARPEVLRQGHGRAAVLGRRGQDDLRQRLRHLGAEVAGRGLRRLGLPEATSSPTTRGWAPPARRRSSASTPRSSTASRCRRSTGCRPRPASRRPGTTPSWSSDVGPRRECPDPDPLRPASTASCAALGDGARPGAGRADHRRSASSRRRRCPATGTPSVHLRLPTYFCAPNFAFLMVADAYDAVSRGGRRPPGGGRAGRPLRAPTPSTAASRRGPASSARSTGRPSASWTACAPTSCARPCWPAPTRCAGRCSPPGRTPAELAGMTLGDVPPSPALDRLRAPAGRAGAAGRRRRAAARRRRAPARRSGRTRCRCTCAGPG